MRHSFACLATVLLTFAPPVPLRADDPPVAESQELDAKIQQLIAQLGAEEFSERERAQDELERMGLYAFDALREAQENEDVEIAMRSRYLVGRLQVNWFSDQDAPEVRKVLKDYGRLTEQDRRSRMDRLALLEDGQGLSALCRLVRFDSDLRLAKHAALQVMKHADTGDPQLKAQRAQMLRETVSFSKRTASQWIRTFSQTMLDPAAADAQWAQLVAEEQRTYANAPELTSGEILTELLRWRTDQLLAQNRRAEALPLIHDSLDLVAGRREQLQAAFDWLIEREVWEELDQLAERFNDIVHDNLLLRYRLAEAFLRRGDNDKSEQLALEASQAKPEQVEEHLEAAYALQERGLFSWAENEYRQTIVAAGEGTMTGLRARFFLSEMLHDQMQDLAAAEVLQPLVDAVSTDSDFSKRARPIMRIIRGDIDEVRARMHFFYAEHFKDKDKEQQKEHLRKGAESYPREIDVLIAMHRFPDAEESWKQLTEQRLNDTIGYYREQIQTLSQLQVGNPAQEREIRQVLAQSYNQLAWLIANTDGDLDEALRYSKLSLDLMPETSSYLDTLGRCYYAKKDYANAVKYQSRAAELEPHSGQIHRQLDLFQKALAGEG